jgi:hypothetical protein
MRHPLAHCRQALLACCVLADRACIRAGKALASITVTDSITCNLYRGLAARVSIGSFHSSSSVLGPGRDPSCHPRPVPSPPPNPSPPRDSPRPRRTRQVSGSTSLTSRCSCPSAIDLRRCLTYTSPSTVPAARSSSSPPPSPTGLRGCQLHPHPRPPANSRERA